MRNLCSVGLMVLYWVISHASSVLAQFNSPPYVRQSIGGSDLQIVHRPDINDSTYEQRYRTYYPCRSCGGNGWAFSAGVVIYSVQDTSINGLASMQVLPTLGPNNLQMVNPLNGDSVAHRVFKTCGPGAPNFILGSFIGTGTVQQPGFQDTFEVIREYCYSRLFTLPYKSGKWQVLPMYGQSFQCNAPSIISGYAGVDVQFSTNLDTTNIYPSGGNWSNGPLPYSCRAIAQINTLVPNSSPYFMSYPVAHFPKGVPVSYKQNAIDPDGDSLVWSSLYMVMWDTAHGAQPASFWAPFPPQMQCSSSPNLNYFGPLGTGMKKVPGYACIPGTGTFPNCTRYDPVYNPFDTDSTYQLNPHTGEITFTAQSAPQTARLLLRCDEYRNGVWVGAVSRRVDFFITDSGYYSPPLFWADTNNLVNCYLDSPWVFYTCSNQPMVLPFVAKATAVGSYLNVQDNHSFSIPGSTVTYQNNGSDSVRGTLSWTPMLSDTGWHTLLVKVFDSACALSPYIREYAYPLRIYVTAGLQHNNPDTTICQGASVQLHTTAQGLNVNWSVLSGSANSLSCTNCTSPWATPSQTTVYVSSGGVANISCALNDTVTIGVVKNFSLQATDTIVCKTDALMLYANATGQSTPLNYQWLPSTGILGSNTDSFIVINPSTIQYVVTATDTLGCFTHSDTSTVVLDTTFKPTVSVHPTRICRGDTVSLTVVGAGSALWSPDYRLSSINQLYVKAWPDTSIVYSVTVSAANLPCTTTLQASVEVIQLRADAGPDHEITVGESVVLGGPDMYGYPGCNLQWFPDKWLFYNNLKNPKAEPLETTTYWVVLTNNEGSCADSATVFVRCASVYVPNAFMPESGDEATNQFGPQHVNLELEYFRVFNRWGEKVFESRNMANRWDGRYRGVPQPTGTFVWVLRGKCSNGDLVEEQGNVLLVR